MAVELKTQRRSKRFSEMKLFKKQAGASRSGAIYLNVTALVDMMTVLVIFLLMQFNASGEMLFISKDLKMAGAENGQGVARAPILSLNRHGDLYFEGTLIASHLQPPQNESDWEIGELRSKLADNQKKQISKDESLTSSVNVQVDRGIQYGVLKRVLQTCESAGYPRIRLAVSSETNSPKEVLVP